MIWWHLSGIKESDDRQWYSIWWGGEGSPRTPRAAAGPKPLGYVPKLEFPKFDGSNCRLWIKKRSKYFHLCNIPNYHKVDLESLFMIEKASGLDWICSWLIRFKGETAFHAVEQFNKLQQTDSIETYIDEFEDLSSVILPHHHALPDEYMLESFVGGLKPGVKPFVKA